MGFFDFLAGGGPVDTFLKDKSNQALLARLGAEISPEGSVGRTVGSAKLQDVQSRIAEDARKEQKSESESRRDRFKEAIAALGGGDFTPKGERGLETASFGPDSTTFKINTRPSTTPLSTGDRFGLSQGPFTVAPTTLPIPDIDNLRSPTNIPNAEVGASLNFDFLGGDDASLEGGGTDRLAGIRELLPFF